MNLKSIKPLLVLAFFTATLRIATAQPEFVIEAAQLMPSFKFKDSEGVKHNREYESLITGSYGIGLRYILESGIYLKGALGLRNAGANLVYDQVNYSWKLQYGELKLGIGYRAKFKSIKPYALVSGYYASLLRGTQTTHNDHLNVRKSGILKNQDFGLQITPGIDIRFTEYISSFVEFKYLMGLSNLELDPGQKTTNSAFGLSVGLAFLLLEN